MSDNTARRCLSVVVPCFNERATVLDGRRQGPRLAVGGRGRPRRRRLHGRHARGARRRSTTRGCGPAARSATPARAPRCARASPRPPPTTSSSRTPTWSTTRPSTPTLLEPLEAGDADVVFGSRFLSGRPHRVLYFWHSLGNRVLTLLSNMFTDLNLTDMETCYKAFRREVLQGLDARGGPLRHRAGDHGQGRPGAVADLRGRRRLRRAHVRRGQEDRVARRLARASCASCATPPSANACAGAARGRRSARRLSIASSRGRAAPHRVTSSIDSTTIRPDIFDRPYRRSVNTIGVSITRQPWRTSRRTSSVRKA